MKINFFLLVIALIVGGLMYYSFSAFEADVLSRACEAVSCTLALVSALAISITGCPRETVMFKTWASIWFVVALLVNILFIVFKGMPKTVIITNCLLFVGGILGLYFIYKASHENTSR